MKLPVFLIEEPEKLNYTDRFVIAFVKNKFVKVLTIFEFILESSSIASSCFFFSGSSVSSFLYFLLLLRKGAKNAREKCDGDMLWLQRRCYVCIFCLNDIRRRNCVHIMWATCQNQDWWEILITGHQPRHTSPTSDTSNRTRDGNRIGPIRFWSSASIHQSISGLFFTGEISGTINGDLVSSVGEMHWIIIPFLNWNKYLPPISR